MPGVQCRAVTLLPDVVQYIPQKLPPSMWWEGGEKEVFLFFRFYSGLECQNSEGFRCLDLAFGPAKGWGKWGVRGREMQEQHARCFLHNLTLDRGSDFQVCTMPSPP